MPLLEFKCASGHVTERFFRTISEGYNIEYIICAECPTHCDCCERAPLAFKVPSTPLQAMLYGNPDGYYKPSATKRFNTKTVSQIEGNSSAVG